MRRLFCKRIPLTVGLWAALLAFGLVSIITARELSSESGPIKEEIRYADGLKKMGLPDYAKIVLERIKDPSVTTIIEAMEVENFTAMGQFDKAKAIIDKKPSQDSEEVWAMKLALADGYYAWGRYADARHIYESLFKRYPNGPPESLNEFYLKSAYKYAQMLLLMAQNKAAVKAYENTLKALPKNDKEKRHIRRQVLGEMSELMVKLAEETSDVAERQKYFNGINKINNEILWVQDLWFGKAIVLMAHVRKMQGDIDGAQKLIDEYGKQLERIDEELRKEEEKTGEPLAKLSPMAEYRYLLGVIMQEEAEKLIAVGGDKEKIVTLLAGKKVKSDKRSSGALQHFMNVFIRYPGTCWAPDAGTRARQVEETLRTRFGAKITSTVSKDQMDRVERFQFQGARVLFNQQQFEKAAESYIKVLNLFTEKQTSVAALSELGRCYIEIQNELYADMVIRYLAERFCRNEKLMSKAGDELVRIAEMYGERNMPDRKDAVYDLYFTHYTKHPRVSSMLFRFGEQKFRDRDFEGALAYYKQIEKNYPDSALYLNAISKIAYCYSEMGDRMAGVKTLDTYIEKLENKGNPGHALINAKYRFASAYKELGGKYIPSAFNRYSELIKLLSNGNNPYQKTSEEAENNRKILEGAMFYKALCYSMLTKPEDKLEAYKLQAIKSFTELEEKFPKSAFAPVALSQVGTLWTVLEKPQEAHKALRRLQKEYPDSEEAKNALFMLGNNLLKLDMKRRATSIFKEMFTGSGEYSDGQILMAGRELFKAGEYEIALEAFDRVLASSKERTSREPAMLGKGKILIEQGKYDEGAKALDEMLNLYPNSGHTVEVCLYLSRAYGELGTKESDESKRFEVFNNAVKAVKRGRKFEKTPGGRARSDVAVARIFELKAKAEEQFGSKRKAMEYTDDAIAAYEILIMTGAFSDPEVRLHMEEAYNECIPLLLKTGKWQDAIDDCDTYLKLFTGGRYVLNVRKWRNRAKVKMVIQDAPEPEAGEK